MHVVTVPNRCTKFKPFLFLTTSLEDKNQITVEVKPPKNCSPVCYR